MHLNIGNELSAEYEIDKEMYTIDHLKIINIDNVID